MTALEELAAALAAYREGAPTLEQEDPHAARLEAAVEAVVLAGEEDLLVELPAPVPFGEHELAEAYARRTIADPDDPKANPVDLAVAAEVSTRRGGSYPANEVRRHLRNADRALRDLVTMHARQLRDLHAGGLPQLGSGLDQERRELARAVHLVEGLTNGLIAGGHLAARPIIEPEEEPPAVAPRRVSDRPQA